MEKIFFGKSFIRSIPVYLVCSILSLAVVSTALGIPARLGKIPDNGANFRCGTCHINPAGGGPRNPFGIDYGRVAVAAGDKYTSELGKLDSDGDGFTNDQEFAAGTHPGNPNSKPAVIASQQEQTEAAKAGGKSILLLSKYLYVAGRLVALVGFALILIQYVLSSRIRFIERKAGLDRLFIVHRKFGLLGFAFIFAHPILLFIPPIMQGRIPPFPLLKILGILTLLILVATAGAAMFYRKLNLKYETWKNVHRVGYVIFPMGFIHSFFMGSHLSRWWQLRAIWIFMACVYVAVLIYKIWNWSYVRRHPFKVVGISQESHDVWSLHFDGKHRNYKPGQFMIVQLERDGKVSESHPFTISSSPTEDRLSISVKSVGDFTDTIGDTKISGTAYIDAPYGVFSFLNHDAQDLVFIAGGIGITPLMSMLRYIHTMKLERNVTLIWGNKTEKDIVFKDELDKMAAEMPSLKVVHIMSAQDDWPGEKGRVDAEKLKKHVSDFQDSQFFLCGPPVMMISVEKTLKSLGVSGKRIHYERFALR